MGAVIVLISSNSLADEMREPERPIVVHALECADLVGPTENLGMPSLWIIISDPWYKLRNVWVTELASGPVFWDIFDGIWLGIWCRCEVARVFFRKILR